jgi:hypothetical protein
MDKFLFRPKEGAESDDFFCFDFFLQKKTKQKKSSLSKKLKKAPSESDNFDF